MDDVVTYTARNVAVHRGVQHVIGTVDLTLTTDRLIATTCGTGLLDRPRTIDVALVDLVRFALVPANRAQQMLGEATYDAELLLSYRLDGDVRRRRILVDSTDPALRQLLARLAALRPEASLLDVEPAEAYGEIGAADPTRTVKILLAVVVGVPVLISLVMIILAATGNAG